MLYAKGCILPVEWSNCKPMEYTTDRVNRIHSFRMFIEQCNHSRHIAPFYKVENRFTFGILNYTKIAKYFDLPNKKEKTLIVNLSLGMLKNK
jgi:hypothetical protein